MKLPIGAICVFAILVVACSDDTGEPPDTMIDVDTAYFVFNYSVSDRDAYDQYLAAVPDTLEAQGANIIVADFNSDAFEGDAGEVTVVLGFRSKQAARGWYQSAEYQKIIRLRLESSNGVATLATKNNE